MSKSHKGCKPWNKGVPRTEKEKENISKGHIGIKISEETRRKLSDRNKGDFSYVQPTDLLWDGCKECGIGEDFDDEEEYSVVDEKEN